MRPGHESRAFAFSFYTVYNALAGNIAELVATQNCELSFTPTFFRGVIIFPRNTNDQRIMIMLSCALFSVQINRCGHFYTLLNTIDDPRRK